MKFNIQKKRQSSIFHYFALIKERSETRASEKRASETTARAGTARRVVATNEPEDLIKHLPEDVMKHVFTFLPNSYLQIGMVSTGWKELYKECNDSFTSVFGYISILLNSDLEEEANVLKNNIVNNFGWQSLVKIVSSYLLENEMDVNVFKYFIDGLVFKSEDNQDDCSMDTYGSLVLLVANKHLEEDTIALLEEVDLDSTWAFQKFNIDMEMTDGGLEYVYDEATEEERYAWEFIVALNV